MKTKIEIKSIFGKVLFELEKENNTIKETLEEAVKRGANLVDANLVGTNLAGANLVGAYLEGANLEGAYLAGANLVGANLEGANLVDANLVDANLAGANLVGANLVDAYLAGANLVGANLVDANLVGAYLVGAYLEGAYLEGAYLAGANLVGANLEGGNFGDWGKLQSISDILIVGSIGSRNEYTSIFHTDKGVFVQCGCFRGTIEEFEKKVKETHQGNNHERDYLAMVDFAKVKFGLTE